MLDHIEDDLFDLAEKAADRESKNAYLDARAQAREKRTIIQDTFRRHFCDLFDRKVSASEVPESLRDEDARFRSWEKTTSRRASPWRRWPARCARPARASSSR
jgi:hypothetical protein